MKKLMMLIGVLFIGCYAPLGKPGDACYYSSDCGCFSCLCEGDFPTTYSVCGAEAKCFDAVETCKEACKPFGGVSLTGSPVDCGQ
jgi:hypothetical protein